MRFAVIVAIFCGLASIASVAAAREVPILRGVYSSEENCAFGYLPFPELGPSYLTEQGVEEFEAGCVFLQLVEEPLLRIGSRTKFSGFVAIGYCQEPGFTTPHVFHVRRFAELAAGRHTVMLVFQDGAQTSETEYYPCAE